MKRDWFRVITELERAGLTIRAIADAVGEPKSNIDYLKNSLDAEPRHSVGDRLLRLHGEYCRDLLQPPAQMLAR